MDKVISVIIVLDILCKVAFVSSKQCVKYNSCACIFDDGSGMVDLSPIGHNDGTAVFVDQPSSSDTYWYSYNPCGTFYESSCLNVAVCQYQPANSVFYDLGVPEKVSFNYNGLSVVVQYQSRDGTRKTFVTLICDPRAKEPVLDVGGASLTPMTDYHMTLSTIAACPVPATYPPPTPKEEEAGLSTGSVLLIIFFVLLFVYLVVGITFNKVWRDVNGVEIIPNSGFWTTLPGLVRDGCAFSVATVCRKHTVYVSML